MASWLLLLWLAAAGSTAPAAAAPESEPQRWADASTRDTRAVLPKALTPGRYRCVVAGILCEACQRAILRELRGLDGLVESRFEEDNPILWLTIGKGKTVRVSRLDHALRSASQRIDLATSFAFVEIRYEP